MDVNISCWEAEKMMKMIKEYENTQSKLPFLERSLDNFVVINIKKKLRRVIEFERGGECKLI